MTHLLHCSGKLHGQVLGPHDEGDIHFWRCLSDTRGHCQPCEEGAGGGWWQVPANHSWNWRARENCEWVSIIFYLWSWNIRIVHLHHGAYRDCRHLCGHPYHGECLQLFCSHSEKFWNYYRTNIPWLGTWYSSWRLGILPCVSVSWYRAFAVAWAFRPAVFFAWSRALASACFWTAFGFVKCSPLAKSALGVFGCLARRWPLARPSLRKPPVICSVPFLVVSLVYTRLRGFP